MREEMQIRARKGSHGDEKWFFRGKRVTLKPQEVSVQLSGSESDTLPRHNVIMFA